ncbi:MAG TPA: hypothetical protein VFT22_23065 [Kofleriaceae bacterium]|nr:hypothetical protein [Kofleriaceae bacterium]
MTACIGEPISWLRLERFALGEPDPAIASHLAACPACARCLEQIRGDVVALPPLVVATARRRTGLARRWWLAPMFAAAAAAIVLLVVRLRPAPDAGFRDTIGVKGVGEVTLELVRERAGEIRFDAHRYAPGDRWKVVVSCPPSASAWIDVSVADGLTTDHPLAAARVACGNRVVVPGAFTLTGTRANRVCARVAAAPEAEAGLACLTVEPE